MRKVLLVVLSLSLLAVSLTSCTKSQKQTVRDLTIEIPGSFTIQERSDGFQAKLEKDENTGLMLITGSEDSPLDMTSGEYTKYVGPSGKSIGEQKAEQAMEACGDSTQILINEKTEIGNIPAVHIQYSFVNDSAGILYRDEFSLLYNGIIYELRSQWSEKTADATVKALESAVKGIVFR